MTAPRSSVDGLRRHSQQRASETRRKIIEALAAMRKQGLAINPHSLANYAGVARKTIYNHVDLLEQIRAESTNPASIATAATLDRHTDSSIAAALREQIHRQKLRYQAELAELKGEIENLEQALAATHGEPPPGSTGRRARRPEPRVEAHHRSPPRPGD